MGVAVVGFLHCLKFFFSGFCMSMMLVWFKRVIRES
jgi:hypothetical protein